MSHSWCCWSTRYSGGDTTLILSCSLFDIPFSTSPPQSRSNRGSRSVIFPASSCASACSPSLESSTHSGASSSYLPSADHLSNSYGLPTLFSSDIHQPRVGDEQVPIPCAQRTGVAITPFDTPDPPRYTGGFLSTPNSGSPPPPIPRLRPASWGSPSQVGGAFESRRLTRSRSSAGYRGDSSSEEDLPFGRRTLPPLPIPYDPWRLGVRTTPNPGSTPSRDLSSDSGDLSATNSVPSTFFHTNYPDRGYR